MTNRRGALCAMLLAALWAGAWGQAARAAPAAVSVNALQTGIVVRSPGREVTISPANGGRIVSFLAAGVEYTRLSADGHGGLIEETHTADYAYQVIEAQSTPQGAVVKLRTDAGPLRVVKEYRFSQDTPLVAVDLTFENRASYDLRGVWAPAVRNLATPSGGTAGRELFCMDRGAGAEVMPAGLFLARPDGPGPFRWIAASDPTARRTLGFAVLDGGCRPIPPVRTSEGMLVTGWACPPVPAGRRLTVRALLAPLEGFATLAELNDRFACDSVPVLRSDPPETRFTLLPFAAETEETSVTTRTYGGEGRELGLCDPLLLYGMQPLQHASGRVTWDAAEAPAWLAHEVYSHGVKLAQFAVPVGAARGTPPPVPAASAPEPAPIEDTPVAPPGSLIPADSDAARRGFVLWRFDGALARSEPDVLDLAVARGGQRTVFLGVRALQDVAALRFAAASGSAGGSADLPPAIIALWHVLDDPRGGSQMVPLRELSLSAGEVAWLALTVDATRLEAGRYGAELTAGPGDRRLRLPVLLDVVDSARADADTFPVWYVPSCAEDTLPDPAQAKLGAWGVSGLTVMLPQNDAERAAFAAAADAERRGWALLAFTSGGGAYPPAGALAIRLALACPRPVWLLDAGRAAAGAARAAAEAGCRPALLCERLGALTGDIFAGAGPSAFVLVSDGCQPGEVARLVEAGVLEGGEVVWLQMDLRNADWRQAAIEVRSAFWAAAWQGLAGAAVTGPAPFREVDRHSPIWHIVRDARDEAALWRAVRDRAAAAVRRTGGADSLRCLALAENAVGTEDGRALLLRPQKRPFRTLLRVAGGADSLAAFERVYRALLSLGADLPEAERAAESEPGQVYWDGIPLVQDGRVRWVIVASDGETPWKRGVALQAAIEAAGGRTVPVSRSFPDLTTDPPAMVWVVGGSIPAGDWPQPLRAQMGERPGGALTVLRLKGGPLVVVLAQEADLSALAQGFRRTQAPYPTARQVR